jgi:uncharacterized protein YjdB
VDENGVVTGVAVGTATVTVTTEDGGHTDACAVTVQQEAAAIPVTGVSLSPERLTLGVGQEQTLTAEISPTGAANKAVTWASSNTTAATVDDQGMVSALAVGSAIITVTTEDGGHTDACAVTVQQEAGPIAVTGVSLNPKMLSLAVGQNGMLTLTVAPPQAANKAVTWTSSDTSVATVDDQGMVSALAEGEATITVTTEDGGHTDTCAVTVSSGGTVSSKTFTITNTDEWNSAIEAVKNGGGSRSYTLDIKGTVSIQGTDGSTFGGAAGVSVAVKGSGELALASPGRIFSLGAGQTLILGETGGSGPTLRGLDGNNSSMVKINNDGTFTMNSGTITGNNCTRTGECGGVYVNGGAFTMNGGTISSNSSGDSGGGVYVSDGSEFTMNGGTISSNSSGDSGGGVYVDGNISTFIMNGGTISSNYCYDGGGGVYFSGSRSTFTMNGGTISDNYSYYGDGGGVYFIGRSSNSTFTMSNGTISDNYSYGGDGGGLYVTSVNGGDFTMSNGTITGNISSKGNGGGVYVSSGDFTMSNGTITGNASSKGNGGGVYVGSGDFTMSNGTISDNYSKGDGGGLYVGSGSFTMSGGTSTGNLSGEGNGGGVYVGSGSFTMNGGTSTGNLSGKGNGGGVYVSNGTFTKSGGSISYNYLDSGNGVEVYYYNNSSPKYRNSPLGEDVNISTTNLETNWET